MKSQYTSEETSLSYLCPTLQTSFSVIASALTGSYKGAKEIQALTRSWKVNPFLHINRVGRHLGKKERTMSKPADLWNQTNSMQNEYQAFPGAGRRIALPACPLTLWLYHIENITNILPKLSRTRRERASSPYCFALQWRHITVTFNLHTSCFSHNMAPKCMPMTSSGAQERKQRCVPIEKKVAVLAPLKDGAVYAKPAYYSLEMI